MINRNSKEVVNTQTAWHHLNWVMNILCNPDRYSHSNKDRKTTESGAIQLLTLTAPTFENEIQDNKPSRTRPHFLRISNCSWGLQLKCFLVLESHTLKPQSLESPLQMTESCITGETKMAAKVNT